MNRVFLTKLHLIAAAFMFPAVLMFLVTGGLYTWGNKGEWIETSVSVPLDAPYASQSQGGLVSLAVQELLARDIAIPSGSENLKGVGADQSLNWGGARSEVSISGTDDPMVAQIDIRQATLHRWLVQLHKAKGSDVFKLYATALALVLFLLVLSGIIMGLQVKALRRMTIISSLAGAVAFVGFMLAG